MSNYDPAFEAWEEEFLQEHGRYPTNWEIQAWHEDNNISIKDYQQQTEQ